MNATTYMASEIESIVIQECKLKGYSQKTIDNYLHHIKRFTLSGKPPRDFLLALIDKGDSDETVRSACFAIKFYLNAIKNDSLEIQEVLDNLPNIKREKKLPVILSKEEIESLISSTKNVNHRLIIQVDIQQDYESAR